MFKRILAVILSISMILGLTAVFTVSAFAMEAPVFEIKKISSDGNRLVASINLTTGAFNAIDISFKTFGLKCVSIRDGSDLQSDAMTGCDTDPAIGVPNISIVSIDGYKRRGEMYVVTFNILSDEYSFDLDITSCTITKDDGSNTDVTDSVAVVGVIVVSAGETFESGTCGENVTYSLNENTGILTISGTGAITDFHGSGDFDDYTSGSPFYNNDKIKTVIIEEGVTRIGDLTFESCESIINVTIAETVTSIGSYAFSGCTGLKNITLPENLTNIEYEAFAYCVSLESIKIPKSITYIGSCFRNSGLKSVTIPESVKSIGRSAFSDCSNLTSVTIPESVTSIGDYTFGGCTGLTSITIPKSVTSIGDGAFNLVNNVIYNGSLSGSAWGAKCINGYIEDGLVYKDGSKKILLGCSSSRTGNVSIPNTVKHINEYAFYECKSLTSVIIPEGVTDIGKRAFCECDSLKRMTIPRSVTSIGEETFWFCNGLTSIILPENITSISKSTFAGCHSLASISIPQSVTTIGEGALFGCESLTSITIPDGVTSISDDAFEDCSGLISVTIPEGVTNIGSGAFSGCSSLTSVTIPDSVTSIGKDAFACCISLINITIPKSVTSIGYHAFYMVNNVIYNGSLSNSTWGAKCVNGYVENGIVYKDSSKKTFIGCSFAKSGSVSIPNTVEYIDEYAFYGCYTLLSVTIPKSVITIDEGAFFSCDNLKDVYYQGSKEDWEKISIGENYHLLNATIHCNNEKTYTVEYNKTQNGGIGQTETRNLDKGEKVDLTLTAAKSGWDFIGWNTDPNAKTGLTSLSVENNNIVLYAIYKKDLTATFIDYSGTAKKTRTVGTTIYNNSTSGKINAPAQNSYTGWTKRGWAASTSPDANVTGTFSISSDTTYYGLYQKTLKLSYNANGGSNVPSSQSGTQYTNSYSISTYKNPTFTLANAISKQGSTFTGWALGSIDGKIYGAGSKITINSNSTMYAAWKNTENIYNLGEETYSFSNFVDEDSYGHCFGMAVTSSGYYLGALNKSIIGGQETSSLYSFSDTAIVRKPICYYMNIQGAGPEQDSMVAGGSIDLHNTVNIKADWNSCVNYVKNHEHDNKGDLNVGMWFAEGNGGHAVNFLYYKEVNGQQRIYVYDNNFPETETYYYMGSDGYVYQAPLQTTDIKIVGIDLIDVNQYFVYAKNFNSRRYIYANKNEITVDGAKAYPMKCGIGQGQYAMYEIPENSTKVYIRPLVDNASFKYNDKIYSFNDVDSKTCGILTVPVKGDSSDQTIKFNIVNDPKVVKSILVSDITLNYKNSANIKLKITADEGAEYTVKYESSNPKVATVDENGKVYAAKRGEATITCTVTDSYGNTVSDTCKVTVNYTFWQWLIKIILFGWIWY